MFKRKKRYSIEINQEDWVTPEETLFDAGSSHSDLEQPINDSYFKFAFLGILLLSAVIIIFTFNISFFKHTYFQKIAAQNKSVSFLISSPRGVIFDRFGKSLAVNIPSFDLLVISKELRAMPNNDMEASINRMADILKIPTADFQKLISENIKTNSMFFAESGLDKEQLLAIKNIDPKGFYVIPNMKRNYIDGPQLSHVIGYVGKVNENDLRDSSYYSTDLVGRMGIEAEYENILRGEHSQLFFNNDENDNSGKVAVPGNNLVLNIDYDLQKKLYNELYNTLASNNLSRAAAIIQNPQNGAVLAMASFPTFNNNSFVSGLTEKELQVLLTSKNKPLFNRAIKGLYNPGSTIKPLMGLMTLEEKIFSPKDTIKDCVSITIPNPFNPSLSYTFKNWREEYGLFNLRKAIANSCNIYFFTAGGGFGKVSGLGIERIAKYLSKSLANSKLGIDLPGEEVGFVPTPDWKLATKGENWYQGDTYNTSIGQGDLLVSPIWLNSYISAIANGGAIYKPLVAQRILDQDKNVVKIFNSEKISDLPFKQETIKEIKSDMEETVLSGTAQVLKDLPVRVGAKTGTAEVIKHQSINSLFAAFAPWENPEIAITVLIEGSASNQGLAIHVSNNVLKWYFGRTEEPTLQPSEQTTISPLPSPGL